MDKFFNPQSLLVVGASNAPFNLGRSICTALVDAGYRGTLFAVNTKGEAIGAIPGFARVMDVPDGIDCAVIIIPAKHVPEIVRQCGAKGIRRLVIESSGFSEEGGEGLRLQRELDDAARQYGIRYIGPNCLGTVSAHNGFSCLYGSTGEWLRRIFARPGSISYIIQSGGVGALIIDSFTCDIVSLNKLVSIGNKADADEADFLDYFARDNSAVIGLYLENVKNGRRFMDAARRVHKPLLAFKVGATDAGARAAQSHTAGMANNDTVFSGACRQAGIIRLESVRELYTLPKIFTAMPVLRGKRIALFTNSGAFGGISADLVSASGLTVARFSPELQQRLRSTGTIYNAANPVDLGPTLSLQTFVDIYDILLSSDEVDGMLAIPSIWQDVVIDGMAELVALCRRYGKPAAIYIPNAIDRIIAIRKKYSLPIFESPEEAVRALVVSLQYHRFSIRID